MKVLKIMSGDGSVHHMPLEMPPQRCSPFVPNFPDALQVEVVDMTPKDYQAIPADGERFTS